MEKFDIEGFEVLTNSDLTEGRGHRVHVCYTSTRALAEEIAKGKGVMGTDADVVPMSKTIKVFDTMDEWNNNTKEAIREKALAKLTKEEREALGL